jgi:hypothetical protein
VGKELEKVIEQVPIESAQITIQNKVKEKHWG